MKGVDFLRKWVWHAKLLKSIDKVVLWRRLHHTVVHEKVGWKSCSFLSLLCWQPSFHVGQSFLKLGDSCSNQLLKFFFRILDVARKSQPPLQKGNCVQLLASFDVMPKAIGLDVVRYLKDSRDQICFYRISTLARLLRNRRNQCLPI